MIDTLILLTVRVIALQTNVSGGSSDCGGSGDGVIQQTTAATSRKRLLTYLLTTLSTVHFLDVSTFYGAAVYALFPMIDSYTDTNIMYVGIR